MNDLSRRSVCFGGGFGTLLRRVGGAAARPAIQNRVVEWSYSSGKAYADPFHDIQLDVVFTGPDGWEFRVPAFWAGGLTWRVRFAPPAPGRYIYRSVCSDVSNIDLHGRTGSFEAGPYEGTNPLYRHGPLRIARDRRHFEHADGTPFFFLADDWWHGLTKRLRWPDEFRALTQDRLRKGFTVIKLTAGLNCDVTEFDPRNENEAGQAWEPAYARIRPQFFDAADLRIRHLVEQGISPSIVGAWGYYLKSMGVARMQKHWRYIVARWGAYPVTWYLSLESDLPYYLSETRAEDTARAHQEWTEVGRYLKAVDGFRRPISMQAATSHSARGGLLDASLLDFDSLHMGHGDRVNAMNCIRVVGATRNMDPVMPVIPGEVCFEGIGWQNWQNIQRLAFWGSLLAGAAGYCYGANGVWQFNRPGQPFGPSPHGRTWGGDTWEVAAQYPGSTQVGLGKKLLSRDPYWRIEPHPEWIAPRPGGRSESLAPYAGAGGIPGQLRIVFLQHGYSRNPVVRNLEPGSKYRALWFDPVTGEEHRIGAVDADARGEWSAGRPPGLYDFVLVLERA